MSSFSNRWRNPMETKSSWGFLASDPPKLHTSACDLAAALLWGHKVDSWAYKLLLHGFVDKDELLSWIKFPFPTLQFYNCLNHINWYLIVSEYNPNIHIKWCLIYYLGNPYHSTYITFFTSKVIFYFYSPSHPHNLDWWSQEGAESGNAPKAGW